MTRPQIDRITPRPAVNCPKNGDLTDTPVTNTAGGAMIRSGGDRNGQQINIRSVFASKAKRKGDDPKGARRKTVFKRVRNIKMGEGSFPKLKIPHQSHADFCSTDTAGGLDNKKRRYAPRGGVAYRLFLWRFPKGATPPFGTRLCEAKCSVLYALSALP